MRRGVSVLTLAVCLAGPETALAQGDALSKADAAQLIALLADPSYRKREQAQVELVRRGPNSLAAVKSRAEDDDLEIRRRCRSIIDGTVLSDDDRFLKVFLSGKRDAELDLPGWTFVRGIVGADEVGRRIYATLYRGDRELLERLEADPDLAASEYRVRVQRFAPRRAFVMRNANVVIDPKRDLRTELTSLLLLAAVERTEYHPNTSASIVKALQSPTVRFSFSSSPEIRRLVEKWLKTNTDDIRSKFAAHQIAGEFGCPERVLDKIRAAAMEQIDAAVAGPSDYTQFRLAIDEARLWGEDILEQKLKPAYTRYLLGEKSVKHDERTMVRLLGFAEELKLKEGVGVALGAAEDADLPGLLRRRAIAFVALFGDERDVPALERLLGDTTVVDSWVVENRPVDQEIRDCALAALIHMNGQLLSDYPIDIIHPVPAVGVLADICFETNDTRMFAQHEWRMSRARGGR